MCELEYFDECCCGLEGAEAYLELWEDISGEIEIDGVGDEDLAWYADIVAM